MKALVIKKERTASLVDKPRPKPGSGEVLLRIRRVGLCGTDLHTFRGENPLISFPRIPGHEISAVVEEVDPGVPETIVPGKKVTVFPYSSCGKCPACRMGRPNACRDNQTLGVQRDGALQEFFVVLWEELIPSEALTLTELAMVEPLTIGLHAVDRAALSAGETVAIFGCGLVGLGAVAGAAQQGARVIAIDIDNGKLALATECGASAVINSREQPLSEILANLTHGDGPDVIIEAVGLPQTFRAAVDEVTFIGRVVYIGYTDQPVEYQTERFVKKELDIRGSRNALRPDFERAMTVLQSGRFPVSKVLTKTVPLNEAVTALSQWSDNPQAFTKIHVEMSA